MRIIQSENPRPLNLLAVGPDGLIAAACDIIGVGGDVEVWTIVTGGVQHRAWVSNREARGLVFTPDGRFLFAAEPEAIVALDLLNDGAVPGPEPILQYPELALSTDGTRLLVTEALDRRGYIQMLEVGEVPTFPTVNTDGTTLRVAAFQTLWANGPLDSWFKLPAISSDGSRVAVARRNSYLGGETIEVRDASTGAVLSSVRSDPADPACQLGFSADGSKLLVRPNGRTVRVFDTATGAPAGELLHPGRPYVTGIAVHPRGPVACSRTNGTVTFWNAETCEQLRTLDWKAGRLVSVAFSPDGSLAAAGTEDGKVVVWDVDL
jgi:WD40 repeat protein